MNLALKPMSVRTCDRDRVTLSAPTRFIRDWVVAHYGERLRALWGGENPGVQTIDVVGSGAALIADDRRSAGVDELCVALTPIDIDDRQVEFSDFLLPARDSVSGGDAGREGVEECDEIIARDRPRLEDPAARRKIRRTRLDRTA